MKSNKTVRLDIACGNNKKQGFIGVDIWEGADLIVDLEKFPWPFEDNSVDEIYCSHYIEHTPDLISFANELHRIMKIGANAEIIAPYYSSIRAWQDPTHVRAISENTFLYFDKFWRLVNKLDHYPLTADFDYECSYILSPEWSDKSEDEKKFAIAHYINVVDDIHAVLTKRAVSDENEQLVQLAITCWERESFREAASLCEQIVAKGRADSAIYLMIGEYAFMTKDLDKAISSFRQALEGDEEESLQAHVGLIRSLNVSGQTVEAQQHLVSITKSNPELEELIRDIISADYQKG